MASAPVRTGWPALPPSRPRGLRGPGRERAHTWREMEAGVSSRLCRWPLALGRRRLAAAGQRECRAPGRAAGRSSPRPRSSGQRPAGPWPPRILGVSPWSACVRITWEVSESTGAGAPTRTCGFRAGGRGLGTRVSNEPSGGPPSDALQSGKRGWRILPALPRQPAPSVSRSGCWVPRPERRLLPSAPILRSALYAAVPDPTPPGGAA